MNNDLNGQINILVEKYTSNTCSREELDQLLLLVKNSTNSQSVENALHIFWERVKSENKQENVDWDAIMQPLMEDLKPETPVVSIKRGFNWKWVGVAASVVFLVGILGYWSFRQTEPQVSQQVATADIIAPVANRAMIVLANGQKVYLDQKANGAIARDGNATVEKTADGKIVYKANNGSLASNLYNTLSNPRGSSVVDITLSDGTRVWLNAGSSLSYPVAFSGRERKVQISGEGYFEVAHNANMPFKVSKANMEVAVLGTHFNVNAYDDESVIKVTLLEGSVKTSLGNKEGVVLKPGQQARVANNIEVFKQVNLEKEMAWKQGMFRFEDTNIKEVMRQVARWYDVEVEFRGDVSKVNFGGSVSRQVNISELLKRLEATNLVKFSIVGRKVIVMPN
ncbi:FecR domain-containing protein [Solitalea lacus]|uniref:FecR domain-containing protein n=1 Tax=Solitalea lacus TaxID=2911172 RepID=UPI001ED9E4D0|nr:FecR domain-containing protein [Solitalea lacus]UKJ06570.1 FecR domain-containing protein [Solitalea lacus]